MQPMRPRTTITQSSQALAAISGNPFANGPSADACAELQAAELQSREELGDASTLVELGETATVDRLLQDLGIEERLDAQDQTNLSSACCS